MKKILVLCTGNSCRSQMAEGYLRHFSNEKAQIFSAGIETHGVNPTAVKVMAMNGIDISNHTSNNVGEYQNIAFDFVLTVCDNANENCPYFPSTAQKFNRNFPDPAKAKGTDDAILAEFILVRDLVKDFSRQFIAENLK